VNLHWFNKRWRIILGKQVPEFTIGDLITVDTRKWGDRPHYLYQKHWLGRDQFGSWLAASAGTPLHKDGQAAGKFPKASITLIPDSAWWVATWVIEPGKLLCLDEASIYIDIATPSFWNNQTIRFIDLDLDVLRDQYGKVNLLDQDEFADHRIAMAYPEEVVQEAMHSAHRLMARLTAYEEPFDKWALRWLETIQQIGITDVLS
jgi:protein associated with RNAse G/E